jgi:hypothetical protein
MLGVEAVLVDHVLLLKFDVYLWTLNIAAEITIQWTLFFHCSGLSQHVSCLITWRIIAGREEQTGESGVRTPALHSPPWFGG